MTGAPRLRESSDIDAYAVYAYETAVVVIQTIDKVGEKDRTKILDTMFATEGFVSLLGGTWSFTENGDTDSAIIGLAKVIGRRDHLPEGDPVASGSGDERAGISRPARRRRLDRVRMRSAERWSTECRRHGVQH